MANGRNISLTHTGIDQVFAAGWNPLSVAYNAMTSPLNNILRRAINSYVQYKPAFDLARGQKRSACMATVGVTQNDLVANDPQVHPAKARQLVRAWHRPIYSTMIHPNDNTPGGMTGQAVLAKGTAAPKIKNVSSHVSELRLAQTRVVMLQAQQLKTNNPNASMKACVNAAVNNANAIGQNLDRDMQGNLVSKDEQRCNSFNHAVPFVPAAQLAAPAQGAAVAA